MIWLVAGAGVLTVILIALRAFERASVGSVRLLGVWVLGAVAAVVVLLLALSGRILQVLALLAFAGPLVWRTWQRFQAAGLNAQVPPHAGGPEPEQPGAPPPPRPRGGMGREEALEILGLRDGASEDDIRAAHRRLMRMAHPDHGGSDWLAARINQARDVLLG